MLKKMISASKEDLEVALAIWTTQFKDREILDRLMCKALAFDKRVNFSIAVEYTFTYKGYNSMSDMSTHKIHAYINGKKLNDVYNKILKKITDD